MHELLALFCTHHHTTITQCLTSPQQATTASQAHKVPRATKVFKASKASPASAGLKELPDLKVFGFWFLVSVSGFALTFLGVGPKGDVGPRGFDGVRGAIGPTGATVR